MTKGATKMSTLVLKKKSLISIYGVSLLFAISSSIFIIYPNLPFSIRNLIFFIVLSTLIFFLDFPPKTKYISTLMFISFMFINHFLYDPRSEEHTSELHSRGHVVCRLLLVKQ